MRQHFHRILSYIKKNNNLHDLGPLYHNYSFFGFESTPLHNHAINQKSKQPIILAYIAYAIAKSKKTPTDSVSFTELFCADGFYAMVASRLGCDFSIGIDSNQDESLKNSKEITKRLGIHNIKFIESEITPHSKFTQTNIVANIGGLYHVSQPAGVLKMSYEMAKKYLIVQSVVSLATNEDDYFESPAPGWAWGNRFSKQSFDRMIRKNFTKIIDCHFNELEGNKRLEDKGSIYYLIEK